MQSTHFARNYYIVDVITLISIVCKLRVIFRRMTDMIRLVAAAVNKKD